MEGIKKLSKENFEQIISLSQFAFQYTLSDEQRMVKKEETERHSILGYMVDGALAGKLHIIPLDVYINGTVYQMGGIASVATWPEFRRQGIAKKLLLQALKEMKQAGQTISILDPFHVGFYRKYGWELSFMNQRYTIPIGKLKEDWNGNGYIRRTDDISLLDSIYKKYAKQYNGMLKRNEKWWEQRVLSDEVAQIRVAYHETGHPEGYIIYKVRDEVFTVIEMAYTSLNGMYLLYEFIGNHDSMAKEVKMIVPENDLLPYKLKDPFFKQEKETFAMARIVDVYNFLKDYPFTEAEGSVHILIEDESFPENSAGYHIQTQSGKTVVTKVKGLRNGDINCTIQQFTSICFGFKRPQELFAHHLVDGKVSAIEQLEKMIPQKQTFLTDFF
ncbi:GNAT family N-acetyltransferase [Pseudogracilibacillus sp. SE30717A]|uniref:GNAT family N-acetyltransferase n=1 Tax=Pseudogracilibacillus sp. SE30717A TaxID=3098293 RepID=UPI00300DDFDA